MVKDRDFQNEAAKIGLDPELLSGENLQREIADAFGATEDVLQRLRDVTHPSQ
jgi:hypothetical protein